MWAPIDALSAALTARFGFMVTVNSYVTPAGSKGFSAHTDHQDVLILQVCQHSAQRTAHSAQRAMPPRLRRLPLPCHLV